MSTRQKIAMLVVALLLFSLNAFAANGDIVVNGQIISAAPTGTAPLVVSSTTLVPNLTAENAENANNLTMRGEACAGFALITVGSSATFLTSVDLGEVTAGDYIDATLTLRAIKGAVSGLVSLILQKSASSAAEIGTCSMGNNGFGDSATIDANARFYKTLSPHIRVNTSGTLVLEAYALSSGSDIKLAVGTLGVAFKKKQGSSGK